MPSSTPAPRTLRADAQRNRDAILEAARDVFERDGVLASLDGIAVAAGVGNATLYRNFPTRDDLLAAVIHESVEAQLVEGASLAERLDPGEALREWLVQLIWQIRIWHDLPSCVVSVLDDEASPMKSACGPLLARTAELVEAAVASGAVRSDTRADELFELVTAVSWGVDRFGDDAATGRRRAVLATAGYFTAPARALV